MTSALSHDDVRTLLRQVDGDARCIVALGHASGADRGGRLAPLAVVANLAAAGGASRALALIAEAGVCLETAELAR
ncbi:MAG TPA: hypothetical protein VG939_19375 [Caulobacteraceae bacterium]|nr:hypothetical protein [Caulobacteraceae bacterium]